MVERFARPTYKNLLGGVAAVTGGDGHGPPLQLPGCGVIGMGGVTVNRTALGDIGNRIATSITTSTTLTTTTTTAAGFQLSKKETLLVSKKDNPTNLNTITLATITSKAESAFTCVLTAPSCLLPAATITTNAATKFGVGLNVHDNDNDNDDDDDDDIDTEEGEDEQAGDYDQDEDEEEDEDIADIVDIDEFDADNTQLVAEYAKDIYTYLHQTEKRFRVAHNFLDGKIVNSKMRAVLIDWLIQVHLKFHLLQETLYLCVQIIDFYLQAQDVQKAQLQLVGVTAMFIASKYEEMYVPAIDDFVYMTDNTYTKAEIRQMEITILKTLNFMFCKPLPLHFLRRFSKAGQADPKQHVLAKYFMELSLHDAEFSSLDPSYLAACSLCLSFKLLGAGDWNRTLEHYSTYRRNSLLPGMHKIAKLVIKSMDLEYKYRAATSKYISSKFMRISLLPELSGEMLKELANAKH